VKSKASRIQMCQILCCLFSVNIRKHQSVVKKCVLLLTVDFLCSC